MPAFVSEEIVPESGAYEPAAMSRGEPSLPPAFNWRGERLEIEAIRRTWRTMKDDRGDTYLKRHYFKCAITDGRLAVIYFERHARRGTPHWFLYTIDDAP